MAAEMSRVERTDGVDMMEGTEEGWIHERRCRNDHGCQHKGILDVLLSCKYTMAKNSRTAFTLNDQTQACDVTAALILALLNPS